ncbi:MAG TPA: DUF2142 domain-containing protein [Opitutaceae bacterium]
MRPESAFLLIGGIFGLALLAANPPFQAPDETDHFARVFQLSEGTLFGEKRGALAGGDLPQAAIAATDTDGIPFHFEKRMSADLFRRLSRPRFIDWARAPRAFSNFPHTVVYAPVAYAPQVVAVFIGRHLRIGPLGLMYLARLAGFAGSIALGYAALRTLPSFRWTILILLLCPMSLYLFGSIASDGLIIAGAALLAALAARIAGRSDTAAILPEGGLLVVLAGALAVAKPVYLPLAAVAFAAAAPRIDSRRKKLWFAGALVLACVLPAWLWGRVALGLFVPANADVPLDPAAQAHHILSAPVAFLGLVAHTIRVQYATTFRWMVGTLGWLDTSLPDWFYPLFGYGALGCLLCEAQGSRLGRRLRVVTLGAAALSALMIYAAQYCSWNAPGATHPIDGVEGRYFLPLLPLLVLSVPRVSFRVPAAVVAAFAIGLSILGGLVAFWAVLSRYYLPTPSVNDREGRIVNVSTQSLVGSKENVFVTGFAVSGNGEETLLIRVSGPSLARIGLAGFMKAPSIRVTDSQGTMIASTEGGAAQPRSAPSGSLRHSSSPFGYPPDLSDASLLIRVTGGNYSVTVSSRTGAAGLAVSEIYEVAYAGTRLSNVSSRAYVGRGANAMLVGLTVAGTETVLTRVDGPALKQFGVTGVLLQPAVTLIPPPGNRSIDASWKPTPETAAMARRVGAFPLADSTDDRADVIRLPEGAYQLRVSGKDHTAGVALVELYETPARP